jgi:hypothetical protein
MGQSIKKRIKKRFRKNSENKVKMKKMISKNQEVLKSLTEPKLELKDYQEKILKEFKK